MCGIAGIYDPKGNIPEEEIKTLTHTLKHRGPDFQDHWLSENHVMALGHDRLSIIDLSEEANQPMQSRSGRSVMVYNGEVYNFKELRGGISFEDLRSSSDTEIVLELLEKKGPQALEELNGMFTLALFRKDKNELLLARDRAGIKPLYYLEKGGRFYFFSELKAILKLPQITSQLTLNQEAIGHFLHLGYIPEPLTIYKEIKKFPKAHYGIIGFDRKLQLKPYWKLDSILQKDQFKSGDHLKEQLHSLIIDSVKMQMVSDVPLGSFLSGGTDSSLVTSVASKYSENPLKTFNIAFKEKKHDESKYARRVADVLGCEHTEYQLDQSEGFELIKEILPTYDQPFGDSSAIPLMLISRLAREEVKVVLTGDGGDEPFLGYGSYSWAKRMDQPVFNTLFPFANVLLSISGKERFKKASRILKRTKGSIRSHIFSQEQYLFSQNEVVNLVKEGFKEFHYSDPQNRKRSNAEKQALFDLNYYLPDDLLEKVDRASMKYGLECRVPLLDHRIIEFAQMLPEEMKLLGGNRKVVLKEILEEYLPYELVHRPKWGFSIPLESWLKENLDTGFKDLCSEDFIRNQSALDAESVLHLIRSYSEGKTELYNKVWHILVFFWWARDNQIKI